jgi:hypothetical protein
LFGAAKGNSVPQKLGADLRGSFKILRSTIEAKRKHTALNSLDACPTISSKSTPPKGDMAMTDALVQQTLKSLKKNNFHAFFPRARSKPGK